MGNIFTQTNAISKRKKIEIPDRRQKKYFQRALKWFKILISFSKIEKLN